MWKNKVYINCLENKVKILKNMRDYKIHIYNSSRAFSFGLSNVSRFTWNENSRHFTIVHNCHQKNVNVLNRFLYELMYVFNRLWYTKISFKGKGFKIKRRSRTKSIKFFFYHSHLNSVIFKKAKLKQKKKNKIIVKTWNFRNLRATERRVVGVRGLNVFTKRGLRTSRQVVFKKTGKKSNY